MLTGKQAKETLDKLLSDGNCTPFPKPYIAGYYKSDNVNSGFDVESDNVFVAFDNTTAECWTEEFASDKDAEKWCSEANPNSPIIVKQLLDKLDYADVYDLWKEHVFQFSEPPELYELINQLSDLIDVDSDVCQAVAETIAKPDDEPTTESPIIISVNGGCVVNVENLPSDKSLEIHDYDIQDDTSDNVHEDSDGEKYIIMIL